MRLSEQIALLLGIVIIVLIGVFISTRSTVKENQNATLIVTVKNILRIEDLPVKTKTSNEGQRVTSVMIKKKIIHKISSNDNLSKISNKYYGDATKWGKIYEANKEIITDPNNLKVGQELFIPYTST